MIIVVGGDSIGFVPLIIPDVYRALFLADTYALQLLLYLSLSVTSEIAPFHKREKLGFGKNRLTEAHTAR